MNDLGTHLAINRAFVIDFYDAVRRGADADDVLLAFSHALRNPEVLQLVLEAYRKAERKAAERIAEGRVR